MEEKNTPTGTYITWTLVSILLVVGFVTFLNNRKSAINDKELDKAALELYKTDSLNKVENDKKRTWEYFDSEDKMTSTKIYFASVEARELLEFGSPYDGGSTATLTVRNKNGLDNVFINISAGQLLTRSYEATRYKVRFDNLQMEKYPFRGPSDGGSRTAFVGDQYKFINNMKKSKKVIIELEFYREGLRQIEFDISNLKWNH